MDIGYGVQNDQKMMGWLVLQMVEWMVGVGRKGWMVKVEDRVDSGMNDRGDGEVDVWRREERTDG